MKLPACPETINVFSWNMMIDTTHTRQGLVHPQRVRLPIFIDTLKSFPASLDVVAVQEVAREGIRNNGKILAKQLGFQKSFFYQHNLPSNPRAPGGRGRRNEYIGLFGRLITNAEPIDIGDNRLAVLSRIGSTAILNFHLRAGVENREIRKAQAERIIKAVEGINRVVVLGDTNERWHRPARQLLHEAGLVSALWIAGEEPPVTFPTDPYHALKYVEEDGTLKPKVWFDDIMVRGFDVVQAGILEETVVDLRPNRCIKPDLDARPKGASDHYGVYAALRAT